MKRFLLPALGLLSTFAATADPAPVTTDSLGNRLYNLNAVTIISNPKWVSNLFEFPGSISYLDTEQIDHMNIHSVKDISTLVPNLFIPDYGSKLISSAYIRGIGSRINSPAVGLYVNNIPYLDKSAFDFDFADIAHIEVLKGPQGTLYGRNTMAGLVAIKTLSPLEKQGSKVKLSFGNYNLWGVNASTSQKITDNLAVALNARYRSDEGYFKNQYTHRNSGSTRSGGGRIQIDWRASQRWKLSLTGDYESSDQQGYPYAYYDKAQHKTGDITYNDEASYRRDLLTSGLSAQYIHDRFIFTSTTGYQYLDDDMHLDQDFTPLSIFTLQQKQRMHAVSQEFAIKSHQGKRWEWVGGLFGFYQDIHTQGPVDFKQDGIDLLITQQTNNQLAALKQNRHARHHRSHRQPQPLHRRYLQDPHLRRGGIRAGYAQPHIHRRPLGHRGVTPRLRAGPHLPPHPRHIAPLGQCTGLDQCRRTAHGHQPTLLSAAGHRRTRVDGDPRTLA